MISPSSTGAPAATLAWMKGQRSIWQIKQQHLHYSEGIASVINMAHLFPRLSHRWGEGWLPFQTPACAQICWASHAPQRLLCPRLRLHSPASSLCRWHMEKSRVNSGLLQADTQPPSSLIQSPRYNAESTNGATQAVTRCDDKHKHK